MYQYNSVYLIFITLAEESSMKKYARKKVLLEQEVLRILSMNARASFSFIGNRIGTSVQQAYRIVKKLENKYGIRYLVEVDIEKLGYIKVLVLARFLNDSPTEREIKEIYDSNPQIQMAMIMTGKKYDLLLYVLVKNNDEINELRKTLTLNSPIRKYGVLLYFTPFYDSYSFVPLKDDFVDTLKDSILTMKSNKGYPIVKEKQKLMLKREFAIIKEWNQDGSVDLRNIDRKYGFDKGRAQYAYYRLVESGIIKRLTVTMTNLPIRQMAMFSMRIFDYEQFYRTRKRLYEDIISETPTPTNKYVFVGDIGSPFSGLLFMPVFSDNDIEDTLSVLSKTKGVRLSTHIVIKMFGRLCFRKFDNAYTVQAKTLASNYGMPIPSNVNYFEKDQL